MEQHRAAIHGGATAEGSTSDVHIEELTHQVELLTHGKSELEQKCHALAVEKVCEVACCSCEGNTDSTFVEELECNCS